jgi:DNA-binding MarR family transcriptional regulator
VTKASSGYIGVDDAFRLGTIRTMDSRDAAQAFNERFMRIYDRYYRRVRPSAYRPAPETLALLQHLSRTGPLTVTEAARHFSRSQAAMSEILTRAEARGLVARATDQRDRRRTLVWLSDAGLRALEASQQVLSVARLEAAFEQLPAAQRQDVLDALGRLLDTEPPKEGWDHD